MKLIFAFAVLIAVAGSAFAQINYPLASVRENLQEASVVVRMNITDTKLTGNDDQRYVAAGKPPVLSLVFL